MKTTIIRAFIITLFCLAISPKISFAEAIATEYLTEIGIVYYKLGKYDDALLEFKKVLMVDPSNKAAKDYVSKIFNEKFPANEKTKVAVERNPSAQKPLQKQENIPQEFKAEQKKQLSREELINQTLKEYKDKPLDKINKKEKANPFKLKIAGEAQLSLGVDTDDFIWKRANADLNEENYRILSNDAYNRKTNTYDPQIFDRLKLNLDTQNKEGFNFHSNISVDPWSFTGKTNTFTLNGAGGDAAEIELKYWSNTGYTIGQTIHTLFNGDSFALPEIKVKDYETQSLRQTSSFSNIFNLPEAKVYSEFQPFRELWFDYAQDNSKIRFFPLALENQALTFDDPLRLSNNKTYWQQSPWLDRWQAGNLNTGATPDDYFIGIFNDDLSYFTRDSYGTRLTALRGVSFDFSPTENLSIVSTSASPKTLWQDYTSFDNISNATRAKYRALDNLTIGSSFTYRVGLNESDKIDTTNYLYALDTEVEPLEGLKLSFEAANSKSLKDIKSPGFVRKDNGYAYYFSATGTFPQKPIIDLKDAYYEIKPKKEDSFFAKYKFFFARMDEGFTPALSSYRETRDDSYWGRHLHFRNPMQFFSSGLFTSGTSWESIEPYKIGNGIDIGRDALGFRIETSMLDQKLDNLFDVRNVHKTNGKFVENVVRDELTYRITNKLTGKFLGIYHKLPKTYGNKDPFIFDDQTGDFIDNTAIQDGMNPTLKTGSLGLEYGFTPKVSMWGIWERTNDSTLAYDNFPRGDLNSGTPTSYREYDKAFRRDNTFLYSQSLFPLPPYDFYNIWKTGLKFNPTEKIAINLDYTRNEFKSAGYIDDNINHVGMDFSFVPVKNFEFYFRYTFSRWNDVNRMLGGFDKYYLSHHNFFTEFRYLPSADDQFALQYGESGISSVANAVYDPYGGLSTLDTRHIVRMYYRRKF